MKRYWLFCYYDYYPAGGLNDLQGTFSTVKAAQIARIGNNYQIWDSREHKLVATDDRNANEHMAELGIACNFWEEV
jgi:hypothetical protein